MDFDYKKHSLERLEEWVNDALLSSEASPQEIYDVIKKATKENYHYFKHHTERCYELLALLNGNGKGHIQAYDEYAREWEIDKTDVSWAKEKLTCDKDDPSPECKGAWNNFWEEYYYPEEVEDDGMRPWGHSDMEYLIANSKQDKVKKWVLPIQMDDAAGDAEPIYYVNFPDDLLEAANLKESDVVEWIDNENGTWTLKKVNQQLKMEN